MGEGREEERQKRARERDDTETVGYEMERVVPPPSLHAYLTGIRERARERERESGT